MLEYYVFVCPKCQRHAQLLVSGSKTVSCQSCNARLQIQKLNVFGPFETQEEAVAFRSQQQAELVRSQTDFSEKSIRFSKTVIGKEVFMKPPKVKKPHQIIHSILLKHGKMIVADCEYYCAEQGIDSETFQKTIQKMIETGEVYRPDKGLLALVP